VSGEHEAPDTTEPSWTTALSEADAAGRRLHQATASVERLSRELHSLRRWSETTARLEVAYALTDGPDGGALNALLTVASAAAGEPGAPAAARMLLDVLTSALGLEQLGDRGELLRLGPDELAQFEVRSRRPVESEQDLYRVVRPGWTLDVFIVVRPLVEAAAD